MNTTPKQFNAFINGLKWKIGRAVHHLRNLDQQIGGIRDDYSSTKENWETKPPTLLVKFDEPECVVKEREGREKRREDRERRSLGRDRARLYIEAVGAFTALVLIVLTAISVQIAKHAVFTAERAAAASQAQAEAARDQSQLAKESTDLTVQAFHQEERAWVGVREFSIHVKAGEPIFSQAILVNSGKTIARDVVNYGLLHMSEKPINVTHWVESQHEKQWKPIKLGVFFPGVVFSFNAPDNQILDQPFYNRIMRGEVILYMLGRTEYVDIFNQRHTTKWCGRYFPAINGVDACETFNEAD